MNSRLVRRYFAFIAALILCISAVSCVSENEKTTPGRQVSWAWRKTFKNADLGNLSMAWNGSLVLFTVAEKNVKSSRAEVIVGLDNAGRPIKDWRSPGRVRSLSADGSGRRLLLETQQGRLYFYKDWQTEKGPAAVTNVAPGAVLSPNGEFIIARRAGGSGKEPTALQALEADGKLHGSYPAVSGKNVRFIVPFLERTFTLLQASETGEVVLSESSTPVWNAAVHGMPAALASSFLQTRNGIIALALGGPEGRILLYNDRGQATGETSLGGEISSLHCSNTGNLCAALVQGRDQQEVHAFSAKGKSLWKAVIPGQAEDRSSVVAAADGAVITAGIEEAGAWSLHAWDTEGKPLWTAPIEGGLRDFRVSWNGKRIAVLTRDGRVAFYDLAPVKVPGAK